MKRGRRAGSGGRCPGLDVSDATRPPAAAVSRAPRSPPLPPVPHRLLPIPDPHIGGKARVSKRLPSPCSGNGGGGTAPCAWSRRRGGGGEERPRDAHVPPPPLPPNGMPVATPTARDGRSAPPLPGPPAAPAPAAAVWRNAATAAAAIATSPPPLGRSGRRQSPIRLCSPPSHSDSRRGRHQGPAETAGCRFRAAATAARKGRNAPLSRRGGNRRQTALRLCDTATGGGQHPRPLTEKRHPAAGHCSRWRGTGPAPFWYRGERRAETSPGRPPLSPHPRRQHTREAQFPPAEKEPSAPPASTDHRPSAVGWPEPTPPCAARHAPPKVPSFLLPHLPPPLRRCRPPTCRLGGRRCSPPRWPSRPERATAVRRTPRLSGSAMGGGVVTSLPEEEGASTRQPCGPTEMPAPGADPAEKKLTGEGGLTPDRRHPPRGEVLSPPAPDRAHLRAGARVVVPSSQGGGRNKIHCSL